MLEAKAMLHQEAINAAWDGQRTNDDNSAYQSTESSKGSEYVVTGESMHTENTGVPEGNSKY